MIVEEVTVRNWRAYREPHTFRFDESLNLLIGRNEAGKSTLFEALQRGLFDRHNGQASEIKAIQPLDSSLGPEVSIVLRSRGERHKVVKRFLQDATAELYTERGGGWELDHEGDKADERIRHLFEGDVPGRGATKVDHRGLAQALWYLQDEAAVPETSWNQAVEKGLQGLVEVVAATPEEEALVAAIEEVYDEHWTPTGKPSSKSEMAKLDEEIPELEAEVAELQATLAKADGHRQDLEEFQAQQETKAATLEEARAELAQLEEAVKEAEALERQREDLETQVEEARRRFEAVDEDRAKLDELDEAIDQLGEATEAAEARLAERRLDALEAEQAAQRHTERWKEELEPQLKDLEARLQRLQTLERTQVLERQRDRLETHLEEVSERREALSDAREAVAELHAPDAETVEQVQDARSALEITKAKAQASAIRVRFDLEEEPAITAEPEADERDDEFLVTRPTIFTLGDLGHVEVRGGGETLEELEQEARELEAKRAAVLDRYDVSDVQALQDLQQRRADLEAEVERLEERVQDLADREEEPEGELARIRDQLNDLELESGDLDVDAADPAEQRSVLEQEREELIEGIEEAQEAAEDAREKHLRLIERAQEADKEATEKRSERKSKADQKATLLDRYGTADQLAKVHEERKRAREEAEGRLEGFLEDYAAKVQRPRKLHEQAKRRVDQLDEALEELERKIDIRIAKIEQITEENPYSRAADLEARLAALRERRQVVETRARAAKVLAGLVDDHQQQRSQALAGPVAEQVDSWLQVLTEEGYDRVVLDEDLVPEAVATSRYQADLPLSELSFGTQEQIVVLLRLAMAVLLSREERQLVVLDDRLVNADPVRIKRLGLILDEASQACQILMATCDDTPYAGVEATRVRVPHDGREGM